MQFSSLFKISQSGQIQFKLGSGKPAESNRAHQQTVYSTLDVTRHDRHNLEIKSCLFNSGNPIQTRLDFYLFMPHSMQLKSFPRSSLINDFQSRLRASRPDDFRSQKSDQIEPTIDHIRRLLQSGESTAQKSEIETEIFQQVRQLGAFTNDKIKDALAHHKRELFLSHSLLAHTDPSERLRDLANQIRGLSQFISDLHELAAIETHRPTSVLQLLDDFIHQLVLDYLNAITKQLAGTRSMQSKNPSLEYPKVLIELSEALNQFRVQETTWKSKKTHSQFESEEMQLHYFSQLKKFFQAELFFDVSKQETMRKFTEPAAIVGATISGTLGILFEKATHLGWVSVGVGSISIATFGIFLYVFKDRIKDRGKNWVSQHLAKSIPDFEQNLFLAQRKVGKLSERFRVSKKSTVPESIKDLRDQNALTFVDQHITEDVLCYSRTLEISKSGSIRLGADGAIREILRINLARYLRYMDDVVKEFSSLGTNGKITTTQSHRVYYYYLALNLSTQLSADTNTEEAFIYRLVMDKSGIQKIIALNTSDSALVSEGLGQSSPDVVSNRLLKKFH